MPTQRWTLGLAAVLTTVLVASAPAAGASGLTHAEKRAMDITGITAVTTSSDTHIEVAFKGSVEEELGTGGLKRARVTIELVPPSGPSTVITDRKASRKAEEGRTGTSGRFGMVRDERELILLVEELPAHTARVEVTTSGPVSARAHRGGAGAYDFLQGLLQPPLAADGAAAEMQRAQRHREQEQEELDQIDEQIDKLGDKVAKAKHDQGRAETKAERDEAAERLKRHQRRRDELKAKRKLVQEQLRITERWIRRLHGLALLACDDGNDNDADSLADHPSDPGCVDVSDNDEKDEQLPVTCPTPGNEMTGFAVINTPQTNSFQSISLRTFTGNAPILSAPVTGTSGGPTPLPGDICGPGAGVTYQYVVYTDGTPFSLPDPPPGEFAICVFVAADNPPASGNPGGQDASLRLAVGTAPN